MNVNPLAEDQSLAALVEAAADAVANNNWLGLGLVVIAAGAVVARVLLKRSKMRAQAKVPPAPSPGEIAGGVASVVAIKKGDAK